MFKNVLLALCLVPSLAFAPAGSISSAAKYSGRSMTMVKVGDVAPDFALKDQSGKIVKLSQFKGKKDVVIFFYPKDDTPGCTKEAQAFNAKLADFKVRNVEVIGVSRDEDHTAFVEKYGLKMTLLSDVGGAIRKAYAVPASLFGALDGRVSYFVGKDGLIKKIHDSQFDPESHVKEAMTCSFK